MKSMLWSFLVASILLAANVAQADTVTYTFVGQGGTAGTSWTLVDTGGYLTVPSGNVISLVQTATDLILLDPMTGPEDFGPLTLIGVGNPPLDPADYGIVLGSSSFTLVPLGIPKADFTTPGTYELTALVPGSFAPDQGALTIAATPEPSFAALMLSGVGLGLMMLMRKRNSHSKPGP
jgi:hypothetical protein